MLQALDRLLFSRPARALRHLAVQAQQRNMPALARAMDWTAEQLWTANGSGYWHSTDPRRKILENWRPKRGTINQALAHDLPQLSAQGDHLDRTTPIFRGVIEGRKAELIGTGIGIKPMTGDEGLDRDLSILWNEQTRKSGALGESLWELQRIASGTIDTSGSILWRGLVLPERVHDGLIPWCILQIPPTWFMDNPTSGFDSRNNFVAGIECDTIGRAVAVHLKNPEDPRAPGERVLIGKDIRHIFERRWALQANGAPRLATLIERVMQDDEIVNNEMKTARVAGSLALVVNDTELRKAYLEGKLPPNYIDIDGGTVSFLDNDSKISGFKNERPSPDISAWRNATVKGDIATGAQVSKVWTDRDGSAYNFANSRFDQLRTQMMVKPAQDWFGESVASWPYEQSLPYLMILAGRAWPSDRISQRRLARHELVPDIPPDLDERAAAEAFKLARSEGIDTKEAWLGRHGRDPAAVAKQIQKEQMEDATASIEQIAVAQQLCDIANAKNPNLKLHWSMIVALPGAKTAPGAYLQAAAPQDAAPDANNPQPNRSATVDAEDRARLAALEARLAAPQQHVTNNNIRMELPKEVIAAMPPQPAPIVNVHVPEQRAADIHVAAPIVRNEIAAPQVTVNVPQQPAPQVTVNTPDVTVENEIIVEQKPVRFTQDATGVVATPI